jgi:2,3-dihydroxy-p-cumate/2,3-dihydroxybenzoate 3,4-dioxygenase
MMPFAIRPLAYACIPVRSPEVHARFASDILGLERSDEQELAFRSDDRRRSIIFADETAPLAVGIALADEDALERQAELLSSRQFSVTELDGEACRRRGVRRAFATIDPTGHAIELVARVELSARRLHPPRNSGLAGFSTVGLRSRDIDADVRFWCDTIGAEVADRVGDITYLRMDSAHHRVALYPSDRAGLVYASLAVKSHDDLMSNAYFLEERQVRIVHGPGLETASNRMFVRFQGPDAAVFAFEFNGNEEHGERRPRQFALDRYALCAWGSPCRDVRELAAA